MPMKNPPHVGETIREDILTEKGLTITKAAELMDVRRATLSDLCNGKAALTAEMALRLERTFGVSADLLLRMQAAHDLAQERRREGRLRVARRRAA